MIHAIRVLAWRSPQTGGEVESVLSYLYKYGVLYGMMLLCTEYDTAVCLLLHWWVLLYSTMLHM